MVLYSSALQHARQQVSLSGKRVALFQLGRSAWSGQSGSRVTLHMSAGRAGCSVSLPGVHNQLPGFRQSMGQLGPGKALHVWIRHAACLHMQA